MQRFARELGKPGLRISVEARGSLREYGWPGNIRELENCIERAAILCDGNVIERRDLHLDPTGRVADDLLREALDLSGTIGEASERALRVVERLKIADALSRSPSRSDAAELLGIAPRTLVAKMKEYGLEE